MATFQITTPSGQTVNVQAASEYDAMQSLSAPSDHEVSQLGSFSRGALSMLPLGDQAYAGVASLGENKPYTQERQELAQEQTQDKEQNPGSTYAGKAAGLIAPIIATGGLAAPESLLGAAGQGALIGGAYGAGNAVDTLAGGGSGAKAAGDVALGAGLGAAGGAAGEGLGNLVGKGADALASSEIGQRLHVENISKALGLNPRSLVTLSKHEGATPEAAAQHVWEDIKSIQGLPNDFVSPTSSINDKLAALQGLKEGAGSTIGVTRNLGGNATSGNFPEGDQAIKDLVAAAEGFRGIPDGSLENMKSIAAQMQAAKGTNNLDFNTMSQIRSAVGPQVQQEIPGASQTYRILSENLDKALDRVGESAGIDRPAFQAAKKTYAVTSKVLPLMQRGAAREAVGASGGLEKIAGGLGLATGHPAMAIPALAHATQKLAAPEMLSNLALGGTGVATKALAANTPRLTAQAAASQAPKEVTPTDLHLQHPAMGPWRQTFAKNAAGAKDPGELAKSHAVTDFTLSQRDPAYAAAKQKAAETPNQQEPQKMADGGIVSQNEDKDTLSQLRDNFGKPVEGFGSTLPGLEKVAKDINNPPIPTEPVRQAAPADQFHQPFNPQFEDQMKAYLMKRREEDDAK